MVFDILEENLIDDILSGNNKDIKIVNNLDLDQGLDMFFPVG